MEGEQPEPAKRDEGGSGCAGAIVGGLALLLVGIFVVSQIRFDYGGGDGTPQPAKVEAKWVESTVELSPAEPQATVRIVVSAEDASDEDGPTVELSVPIDVGGLLGGPTLDPGFALVDPAVEMRVVNPDRWSPCAAPCEMVLAYPRCSSSCQATFDLEITLAKAAGRQAVRVTVRAGRTGALGASLPRGWNVSSQVLAGHAASPVGPPPGQTAAGGSRP